jgi:hypothetical protein
LFDESVDQIGVSLAPPVDRQLPSAVDLAEKSNGANAAGRVKNRYARTTGHRAPLSAVPGESNGYDKALVLKGFGGGSP